MKFDGFGTPCLLYCGSCRYFMNDECKGCGSESRPDCNLHSCCVKEKGLRFCSECDDFPCESLSKSVGVHPDWLKDQAQFPPKKWET